VHIDYLHGRLRFDTPMGGGIRGFYSIDRHPKLTVIPTDYGAFYSAKRRWDDEGNYWHRISQFILPFHTMIAAGQPDSITLRSFVPLDDHYTMLISQNGRLDRPITDEERLRNINGFQLSGGYLDRSSDPRSRYFTSANKRNDFKRDFALEQTSQFCGILFDGNLQDRAMTELMCNEDGIEPIYDRSKEHLGTTDSMVIIARRLYLRAAKALRDEGRVPANVDNPEVGAVRSASVILPAGANWIEASAEARKAGAAEVAYVAAP
jgi:hypothetical protein